MRVVSDPLCGVCFQLNHFNMNYTCKMIEPNIMSKLYLPSLGHQIFNLRDFTVMALSS